MTRDVLTVLMASFALASSSAQAGVTHITSVANETDEVVEIRNFENPDKKGHNATVPAQDHRH